MAKLETIIGVGSISTTGGKITLVSGVGSAQTPRVTGSGDVARVKGAGGINQRTTNDGAAPSNARGAFAGTCRYISLFSTQEF